MTFWIVITLLALAAAALIALVMLRSRPRGEPAAAYDLKVYRQQLREAERDLARGLINEADATRVRTEISRRILAADAQLQAHQAGQAQPRGASLAMAVLAAAVLTGGSLALYSRLGAPGYGDLPLQLRLEMAAEQAEARPTQDEAEAHVPPSEPVEVDEDYAGLITKLRETASQREDDAQGQALLAQHEAALGNFKEAYTAKLKFIGIMSGDIEARDHGEAAELMIMAANGYVSPEAEEQLRAALARDSSHGPSRYYWGIMLEQTGRPDMAFQIWRETLEMGPPNAPWNNAIAEQIQDMAWRAGVNYQRPATAAAAAPLAGPTAEDLAASQDLEPEDRNEMIRGMVDGLAERLATEGGTAEQWGQLITSLAVLGDTDRARTIHGEAVQKFAADEAALAIIADAAGRAGILQ